MMSRARAARIIVREYKPDPDACAQALALLLSKPVSTEGSPTPATLDDDGTRIEGDSADDHIIR
jgi:hypothetical protein